MVSRFFLDTNAVISLFAGNRKIADLVASAEWIGISIITKLEFLSYEKITPEEEETFLEFCSKISVENIENENKNFLMECVKIRKEKKVKLPDAIIAAQAIRMKAQLITSDLVFKKIENLNIINFLNVE